MSSYVDIYNNKQANIAAKIAATANLNNKNIIDYSSKISILLTYLKY